MAISINQSQRLWMMQNRQRRGYYLKWAKVWKKYYAAQGRIIAENFNQINLPNLIFIHKDVSKIFADMYADVGSQFAVVSYISTKNANPTIQVKRDEYTAAQIRPYEDAMRNYATTEGAASIISISETGRELAMKIIQDITADGIDLGLGIDDLADYIEAKIPSDWRIAGKFNAERIARTEVLSAASRGSYIGAEATNLPLNKVWLTVMDGRERGSHASVNRQERGMYDAFDVGGQKLMHPQAKGGNAANVINCRCATYYRSTLFD